MNKDEFLQKLEDALTDAIPPSDVAENLSYYRNYFSEEEHKGRTDEDILEELGDPRLIAHTIIDTTPTGNSSSSYSGGYTDRESYTRERPQYSGHSFNVDLSKWYWKAILAVIVFFVIMFVISIVTGLLSLLLPVLPIVIIVAILMMAFGGGGRSGGYGW